MTDAVCIPFPTIMSGLVLRWYEDETQTVELANAGREEARVLVGWCSERVRDQAVAAHKVIKAGYDRRARASDIDVSQWVTHRRVGGLLSHDLEPVAAAAAQPEETPQ
jgi:hypothetical protein